MSSPSSNRSPSCDSHLRYPRHTLNSSSPPSPQIHDHKQQHFQSNSYYSPSESSHQYSPKSGDGTFVDVETRLSTNHTTVSAWSTEKLVDVLTEYFEQLCAFNQSNGASGFSDQNWIFFSGSKEKIGLKSYISRLVEYSLCSPSAFVILIIYIDRIENKCEELLVTDRNCYRLLCSALVLAIKYLEDQVFLNSSYAFVGGIRTEEMNQLEIELLNILDWNLSVSLETFSGYEKALTEFASVLDSNNSHALDPEQPRKKRRL